MQFTNLFVSLLLTTAVAAKGKNGTTAKAVTDKSLCKEMASLTKLVALASNETKLADKTNNNATKIAEIQAKASDASTQLSTMESNATLVSTCAVIASAQKTEDDCDEITSMTKLVALAANETALAEKSKNNATKIAALQAKASTAATKLQTLEANTTLTDACSSIKSQKEAAKAAKNNNGMWI
jgi:ABC-type enterochelin transport system substrate-binding protein